MAATMKVLLTQLVLAVLLCCCYNVASAFVSPALLSSHPTASVRRTSQTSSLHDSRPLSPTVRRLPRLSMAASSEETRQNGATGTFAPTSTISTTTSLSSSVEATHEFLYYTPQQHQHEEEKSHALVEFDVPNDKSHPFWTNLQGHGVSLEHPSLVFARGLIVLASAVYGTNFAMVKMLDTHMPFEVSAALRFVLAATVVTTLVLRGEQQQQPPQDNSIVVEANDDKALVGEQQWAATVAGMEIGAWYCLGYLCQSAGLQTADASKSAFFNALAVIVVPLLDSFFREKQMGPKEISSVALAIAGVGLLQLGPSVMDGVPIEVARGDVFCLGQALMFGIGYWRLEVISSQHPTQAGRITIGQLVGVALGATIFMGATQRDNLPTLDQLKTWFTDPFIAGALAWTALVSTALALYLETVALKAVSAAELTVLMTSVSIFGSGFAYITMGETMSPIGMVGGLMILAGCVFSSLGGSTSDEESIREAPALPLMTSVEPDIINDVDVLAATAKGEDNDNWKTNSLVLDSSSIAL